MPKVRTVPEKLSTQIVPVTGMAEEVKTEIFLTMGSLGIVRSESYNKLGSVKHWGLDWKKAYPLVRAFRTPESLNLPSKLMEWTVSDVAKAISAQQAACIEALGRKIYQRYPGKQGEAKRKESYRKLGTTEFLSDPFLHRLVRKEFHRGHSWVKNQIVYQQGGYKCKRLSRHTYQLELAGLRRGKRNPIKVRSNRKISGQIRLIYNTSLNRFEVNFLVRHGNASTNPRKIAIGIDKGYTEAFYDSRGNAHGVGLGKLASAKSERINAKNRHRQKLWALSRKFETSNPAKSARILNNNLTRNTENRRYRKEKAAIASLIGQASKSVFNSESLQVFAEDLTAPIKGKRQYKAMSRKLNSWMKGYLRDSLQKWANWTGSVVTEIQASYTSQVDSVSRTLLGQRNGDSFIRFTGDVLHSDYNAALNILARGTDPEISRYMRKEEVQTVLLRRTARFLEGMGLSLVEAVELGWLDRKHSKTQAFKKLVSGS